MLWAFQHDLKILFKQQVSSEYFKYCVSRILNTAKEESLFSINPAIKKESSRLDYKPASFDDYAQNDYIDCDYERFLGTYLIYT